MASRLLALRSLQSARFSGRPPWATFRLAHLHDTHRRAARCFSGEAAEGEQKALLILRKKMLYQARNRADPLLADFLIGFVEAAGPTLQLEDGDSWAQLMDCEEEFLMNLAAAKTETPKELASPLLARLQDFLAKGPPKKGLTGESPWQP
mmetsp:Transcript_53610/g.100492  ORF Transcript_53610/g.100492 Transcript_53610/m.100492 type:complete len:150 (-) Transcript_53610:30-479(-)